MLRLRAASDYRGTAESRLLCRGHCTEILMKWSFMEHLMANEGRTLRSREETTVLIPLMQKQQRP